MLKDLELFLARLTGRWAYLLLLSILFSIVLWRAVFWVIPLSYGRTFALLISIGLIADFITLIVKQKE